MELLTIEEVAAIFKQQNRKTIDNWLYNGTLPRALTVKIGKHVFFVKPALEKFIQEKYEKQIIQQDIKICGVNSEEFLKNFSYL